MAFTLDPSKMIEAGVKKAIEKFTKSHPHLNEIPGLLQKAADKLKPVVKNINRQDVHAMVSTVLGHRLNPEQITQLVVAMELGLRVVQILVAEFDGDPDTVAPAIDVAAAIAVEDAPKALPAPEPKPAKAKGK